MGPEAGGRLDRFLERSISGLTRSQAKRLIDRGLVRVDERTVKAGHVLRPGETIRVTLPSPPSLAIRPQSIPVPILYEDESLLVVDKPPGMVVHPGAGRSEGTLVNALLGRGIPLSTIGAPHRPGIVHRLDKGTSGLLVVAKTDAAHRALSSDLAARAFERRYWALVWGLLAPARGRITGSLARSRADRRRMRVVREGGRAAATRYVVCGASHGLSALELTLETGRTHQIRAHFKHLGHPVFGDPDYGGRGRRLGSLPLRDRDPVRRALALLARQALHAGVLGFRHPVSGKALAFESDLPEDIRGATEVLGVSTKPLRSEGTPACPEREEKEDT